METITKGTRPKSSTKSVKASVPDRQLTIHILKGENLEFKNKINPYIKITAKNSKGIKKIYQTKAKLRKTNPIWSNETFQVQLPIFPIECACLSDSTQKTAKTKEQKKKCNPTGHFSDLRGRY